MSTFSELKSRCKQAMTELPSNENEIEESALILCQNDWVRILTVRDSETSKNWRIEVEVSLPAKTDSENGEDVNTFIKNLIKHLEYLLSLEDEGLTLVVMTRDSLWTAYLEIDELPPDRLFKALIPPSV